MRNFLFIICTITYLYSCSSDEKSDVDKKPDIDGKLDIRTWMQNAIGTENQGNINKILWNDSTFYSMTGIKDQKLRIGFFKDENYSNPIFIWTASESFPASCEYNKYGYDEKETYNLTPYEAYLEAEDLNNFSGIVICRGIPDKQNIQQGAAEEFFYAFFVIDGKYNLINEPLTAKNVILYTPIRWYDKSVAVNNKLYTKEGEEFSLHISIKTLIPINLSEGIDITTKSIKRKNILTGESIWEIQINEDIDTTGNHPPIIGKTSINKNGNKWEFHLEIVYYNGDKETRVFTIDIETGEIQKKDTEENQ